jgi:thiol-disulfide isomerase/thioredoxin
MNFVGRLILLGLISISPFAMAKIDVGDTPFDNVGKTFDKSEISVSQFKGKVVILTFWATWCPPCMKELPILNTIQKKVGTEDLQVISVNYKESRKTFQQVAKVFENNKIIITHDKRGYIGKQYGVKGIPHMLIIGHDGRVKAIHIGYDEAKLPALVEEIVHAIAESKG